MGKVYLPEYRAPSSENSQKALGPGRVPSHVFGRGPGVDGRDPCHGRERRLCRSAGADGRPGDKTSTGRDDWQPAREPADLYRALAGGTLHVGDRGAAGHAEGHGKQQYQLREEKDQGSSPSPGEERNQTLQPGSDPVLPVDHVPVPGPWRFGDACRKRFGAALCA